MGDGIGYLYVRIASDAFEERRNIERQLTSRDVPSIRRDGSAAYAVVCVTCSDVQRSFTSGVLATVSATTLRAVNTWRILRATRESRVITTMLHETFLSLSFSQTVLRPYRYRLRKSTAEQRAALLSLSRIRPLREQRLFGRRLLCNVSFRITNLG